MSSVTVKDGIIRFNRNNWDIPKVTQFDYFMNLLKELKVGTKNLSGKWTKISSKRYIEMRNAYFCKFENYVKLDVIGSLVGARTYIIDALSFYILAPSDRFSSVFNGNDKIPFTTYEKVKMVFIIENNNSPLIIVNDSTKNLNYTLYNSGFVLQKASQKEYDEYIAEKFIKRIGI